MTATVVRQAAPAATAEPVGSPSPVRRRRGRAGAGTAVRVGADPQVAETGRPLVERPGVDPLAWLRVARSILRLGTLSATAGLLFWALMPVVIGWEPTLVVSGSMMPAVRPGDIVVVAPVPTQVLARSKGMIVLVDDPAVPGSLLLHRAVGHAPDGGLLTKGDANNDQDRAAVPLDRVHGAARLRVPYAGLPVLWLRNGRTVPVIALAVVLMVLAWPERHQNGPATGAASRVPGRHRS